ncbi:Hypothetical Protein FCC1311_041522 [Hondaea fermentalgiana]|uniref:SET domain-containing protein n=1 Tax=Hondaea fermentalgiana TaxID=2315210 RepID=A0A2R5GC79_9STRA|nr:Hypothetical Protein FCC1311_041522 [Hondaea fermentalgiana]|eukprot:GBG27929.1 Hypothetical Protein FCC1311_041522 [Hondaea fermentalgiana]
MLQAARILRHFLEPLLHDHLSKGCEPELFDEHLLHFSQHLCIISILLFSLVAIVGFLVLSVFLVGVLGNVFFFFPFAPFVVVSSFSSGRNFRRNFCRDFRRRLSLIRAHRGAQRALATHLVARALSHAVEVRESSRGATNAGRVIGGHLFPKAGQAELGVFAQKRVEEGKCVGFVHADDVFSAANVVERSKNPLVRFAADALQGYQPLREAKPVTFDMLELALLLWMERRSEGLGFASEHWSTWAKDLPECCPGNGAYQTTSNLSSLLSPALKDFLSSEDMEKVLAETKQYDRLFETFSEALGDDLIDALQIVEAEGASFLWGRGDSQKQNWPFGELFREELSLVLSRSMDLRQMENYDAIDPTLAKSLGDLAILPGFDFVNHSDVPNAEIVFPAAADRPTSWLADCSGDLSGPSGAVLRVTRPVDADEEILIDYGAMPGRERLFRYGFVSSDDDFGNFMARSETSSSKGPRIAIQQAQ